jgi:hypothetical protein
MSGQNGRRTLNDWKREVYRSRKIGDPVRVLLLCMADHMRADRTISVPRATLAKAIGKSERRVSERVSAAHKAGLLSTVSAGYRGHTAVYQGLFPDHKSGTSTSPLSGAETRPLSTLESGTPGGPTISKTQPSRPNIPAKGKPAEPSPNTSAEVDFIRDEKRNEGTGA